MKERSDVRLVRRGECVELSVGGTQASWYQPGRVLTGSVWDALAVPVLLADVPDPRVLILGLGGGSAARLLRALRPRAHIVGVELDPAVVASARAAMDLDELGIDVYVGDALAFLERPGRYDLVIEDCYAGGEEGLTKPWWMPAPGLAAIGARLAPSGLLVCDVVHEVPEIESALRARYPHVLRITLFDCTNQVLVASEHAITGRALRRRCAAHPLAARALGNLRFRTLSPRRGPLRPARGAGLRSARRRSRPAPAPAPSSASGPPDCG